jgi:hypothetical protein
VTVRVEMDRAAKHRGLPSFSTSTFELLMLSFTALFDRLRLISVSRMTCSSVDMTILPSRFIP